MLHTPTSKIQQRDISRAWALAELDRLREKAAAKLLADARRDWQIYSRLANIPRPAPKTPAREIVERVAAWHLVSVTEIMSRSRRKHVIAARFDAVAAVKLVHPQLSLHGLAKIFDCRDHTSILNALQRRGVSCSLAKA